MSSEESPPSSPVVSTPLPRYQAVARKPRSPSSLHSEFETERVLNVCVAVFNIVVAFIVLLTTRLSADDWQIQWTSLHAIDGLSADHVGRINLGYISVLYLLIGAFFAMVCCSERFIGYYEYNLRERRSPARWSDAILTLPWIHFQLAMLLGVSESHMCFALVGLTCVTYLFPLFVEQSREDNVRLIGVLLHGVSLLWVWALLVSLLSLACDKMTVPAFVWVLWFAVILHDLLLFFNLLFSVVSFKLWSEFSFVEDCFIVLSAAVKNIAAWSILAGMVSTPDLFV
jgi:hypothetical protein